MQGVVKGRGALPIFGTRKRSAFSTDAQSRSGSVGVDIVLEPPRLVWHISEGVLVSPVLDATREVS